MTALQKVQLRLSEIRKRLAELGAVEQMSDEQRTEIGTLRTEYGDLETRSQAPDCGRIRRDRRGNCCRGRRRGTGIRRAARNREPGRSVRGRFIPPLHRGRDRRDSATLQNRLERDPRSICSAPARIAHGWKAERLA